jgi:membrane-associated phospholipid phosphatase
MYPFIAFTAITGLILVFFSKTRIHIFINEHNNLFADWFFRYYTNLGDGMVPLLVSIFLLFFSVRKAFLVGLSTAFAGLLSQFFKQVIFPAMDRPKLFFQNFYELHLVRGVEIHSSHSFPSGHTTTAFCLFLVLAYFTDRKWLQLVYFLLACLVGYSRIYLSQHFLIDVFFGALFGTISALIFIYFFESKKQKWPDKSIITIISRSK